MRMINPDENGEIICPQCRKKYKPELPIPAKDDRRSVQSIYPDSTPSQREQLLTGICSDKCWDIYLGAERGVYNDKGECISGSWRKES